MRSLFSSAASLLSVMIVAGIALSWVYRSKRKHLQLEQHAKKTDAKVTNTKVHQTKEEVVEEEEQRTLLPSETIVDDENLDQQQVEQRSATIAIPIPILKTSVRAAELKKHVPSPPHVQYSSPRVVTVQKVDSTYGQQHVRTLCNRFEARSQSASNLHLDGDRAYLSEPEVSTEPKIFVKVPDQQLPQVEPVLQKEEHQKKLFVKLPVQQVPIAQDNSKSKKANNLRSFLRQCSSNLELMNSGKMQDPHSLEEDLSNQVTDPVAESLIESSGRTDRTESTNSYGDESDNQYLEENKSVSLEKSATVPVLPTSSSGGKLLQFQMMVPSNQVVYVTM